MRIKSRLNDGSEAELMVLKEVDFEGNTGIGVKYISGEETRRVGVLLNKKDIQDLVKYIGGDNG